MIYRPGNEEYIDRLSMFSYDEETPKMPQDMWGKIAPSDRLAPSDRYWHYWVDKGNYYKAFDGCGPQYGYNLVKKRV